MAAPLRVDLIATEVDILSVSEWCPHCALPSATAMSFSLITVMGQLVRRFEHVVICNDCAATVSMAP